MSKKCKFKLPKSKFKVSNMNNQRKNKNAGSIQNQQNYTSENLLEKNKFIYTISNRLLRGHLCNFFSLCCYTLISIYCNVYKQQFLVVHLNTCNVPSLTKDRFLMPLRIWKWLGKSMKYQMNKNLVDGTFYIRRECTESI